MQQTGNSQEDILNSILLVILDIDPGTFVVGGAVRDHFLGKHYTNDLDLVVATNGFEVAEKIVSSFGDGVTHVPLHIVTGTSRLVIRQHAHFYIDICSLQGADIYEDLARRDFTINAMALPLRDFLHSKFANLIDPAGGLSDLSQRLIRACSESCFKDDPLRILRAYRFAALLSFRISSDTRMLMKPTVPKLPEVSAERLREEIFLILSQDNSFDTVDMLQADKVLDQIFPELIASRGCAQNDYHHLDVFDHALETLRCLETMFIDLPEPIHPFKDRIDQYLESEVVKGRPRMALLKLAALFHDVGKPHSLTIDSSGRRRFLGHEKTSQELVKQISHRLRLSRREQDILSRWVGGHMRGSLLALSTLPPRGVRRLCREFDTDIIGLLLLIIADRAATRGPQADESELLAMEVGAAQVLDYYFQSKETKIPFLLNGHDLINLFGMTQGPEIGKVLRIVRELQEDGLIDSRETAIDKVRTLLKRG